MGPEEGGYIIHGVDFVIYFSWSKVKHYNKAQTKDHNIVLSLNKKVLKWDFIQFLRPEVFVPDLRPMTDCLLYDDTENITQRRGAQLFRTDDVMP